MSNTHPTAGRCKRCGAQLPRLWLPHPAAPGELVADRWCSDHCYGVELLEQSQRACRASRIKGAAMQREERDAA